MSVPLRGQGSHLSRKAALAARYLGEAAGALGIVSGALLAFEAERGWGVVCACASVLAMLLAIVRDIVIGRRRAKRDLRAADSIFTSSDVRLVLTSLAERMSVPLPWRISLYQIEGNEWTRLIRRSSFPRYEDAGGRPRFPSDSGCLGTALRLGVPDEIPWLPDPHEDFAGYVEAHLSRRITHDTIDAFRMKSRSYVAGTFEIRMGAHQGRVVGIVVESEEPNGVTRTSFSRTFSVETVTMIHTLVRAQSEAAWLRAALQREREGVFEPD